METDELAALACKWQYAAQSTLQRLAVYGDLCRIVGWNHRVVVRVAAINQSASHNAVSKLDFCASVIKLDDSVVAVLAQNVLQQRSWLLRQVEIGRSLTLDAEVLASHQFMTIAGNHGKCLWSQVEIDTVHHRAQLV